MDVFFICILFMFICVASRFFHYYVLTCLTDVNNRGLAI